MQVLRIGLGITIVTPVMPSPNPSRKSWMMPIIPPSARNMAYIEAIISRNRIGAMVFPEPMIASRKSRQLIFLNTEKTMAPPQPTAADSEGVKKPANSPPSTSRMSANTPEPLTISATLGATSCRFSGLGSASRSSRR